MSTLIERRKSLKIFSFGDKNNLVIRLILINLIVFAGIFLVKMIFKMTTASEIMPEYDQLSWVVLSANPQQFITHPWTILTYMFVNTNFWLLLSCMVWFWGYGTLTQGLYGTKLILPLYILGGVAGGIVFFAAFQLVPGMIALKAGANSLSIGSSASVMAIIACLTVLNPKYRVFPMIAGGFPLYALSIIYLAFCFFGRTGGWFYGYLAASIGGLALGLYFGYRIKKGYQPGAFVNNIIYQFAHFFDPKDDIVKEQSPFAAKEEIKPLKKVEKTPFEESVDDILDKINKSGYDSLTSEEREILVKASQED